MNLFIGCSSKNEILKKYQKDCEIYLSKLLEENNLVFGADNTGLMGLSHNIAKDNDREIIGICPEKYKHDFKNLNCTIEITTNSTIERINKMVEYSDALIFLPGGIGSLAELFVSIDSIRCHEFDKPIIIYNCMGIYNDLMLFLKKLYNENFITKDVISICHISNNAEDTINYIEEFYKEKNKSKVRIKK